MSQESDSNSGSEKPLPERTQLVKRGVRFETPVPCPECGGSTEIVIDEWETGTGHPKEGGFRLICCREERELEKGVSWDMSHGDMHFYWQSVWQTAIDNAYLWMIKAGIKVSTENTD
jgi:hypothetical protein